MDSSQSHKNPFEQLVGKPLTPEQVAEMRFNLTSYVEVLMQMDKQHKEWLQKQAKATVEKTGGSDIPPEVIN
jgi:hypothetical protein